MTDFYFRWGDDVQPYVLRLASEYTRAIFSHSVGVARLIQDMRNREGVLVLVPRALVRFKMINGRAHHRFDMLDFKFRLIDIGITPPEPKKRCYELRFQVKPDFAPEDMPRRLRRKGGTANAAIIVRPIRVRTKRKPPVKRRRKKNGDKRVLYNFGLSTAARAVATLVSRLRGTVPKMYDLYRKLYERAETMWRRRPHWNFSLQRILRLLTRLSDSPTCAPARGWLEARQIGGEFGLPLILYTLVLREPPIDWDAWLFGEPDESERMPA